MFYSCPSCGSENTQKISILYDSGTSKSAAAGVAFGGGAMGIGALSGYTRSSLAASISPPQKRSSSTLIFGIMVMTVFCAALLASSGWLCVLVVVIIGVAASILVWIGNNRDNKRYFEPEFSEWGKRFFCLRCGRIFLPDARR